jgi:hypothetical protein
MRADDRSVKQVLTPDKACHRNQTNIALALLASRAQQKADNNNPHKHEVRTCFEQTCI